LRLGRCCLDYFRMTWAWLTLTSGVLNALWSSQIKGRVQKEGALTFTLSIRWGVALSLLPFALFVFKPLSLRWWIYSALSGSLECASLWALTRGTRKDFYSTYALNNMTPLFSVLWAAFFLGETISSTLGMGVLLVVIGALWLYYRGHWSWWGLAAALISSLSGLFSKLALPESGYLLHSCFAFLIGAVLLSVGGLVGNKTNAQAVVRNTWLNRVLVFFSAVSTVAFYAALQMAPLSRVSPLVRINLVVGFFLSYFFLREREGWKARGFGAILILAGLVLVLWKA
jgi:bacterial/archaeal transporter family protein